MQNSEEYQRQLENWANYASDFYNALGSLRAECPIFNNNYYGQSPLTRLKEYPDLLICGINPGSDQCDFQPHTANDILNGNTVWSVEQWPNIKKFGFTSDELSKCILTNFTMFASKSKDQIEPLIEKTLPVTIKMFEVIKPRRIILLSGSKAFAMLEKYSKQTGRDDISFAEYVTTTSRNQILIGTIVGIPTLGIPHPNMCPNTRAIANVVRTFLNGITDKTKLQEAYGHVRELVTIDDLWLMLPTIGLNTTDSLNKKTRHYLIGDVLNLYVTKCEAYKTGGGYAYVRIQQNAVNEYQKQLMDNEICRKIGWKRRNYCYEDICDIRMRDVVSIQQFKEDIISLINMVENNLCKD